LYKKKSTKNGLKMVVSTMPGMSSVSLGVWIGVGGRYEAAKQSGISHLIEHMLFKGTLSRDAMDLKQSIEGVGGSFNGFTADEVTCYMVKVPSKYMELGMEILGDMVLNPKFDEAEISREKFVICEEIKMYRDQPAEHVMELLGQIMWPGDPLGRPLTGSMTTVKGFSRNDIIKFKEERYYPGNIAVVAAGKVDPEKFFISTSRKFAGVKKGKSRSFKTPKISQKGPKTTFHRGDTKQTHIAMGFHAPDRNLHERFAMKLMNVILGGNMSSRLFDELREKRGLCYDISSMYKRHSDVGDVVVHAGVDTSNAMKSVIAVLNQLRLLKDKGVTRGELKRAREYAKGQFLLAMEGTSSRMVWLGDRLMVHKEIPEVKYVVKMLDQVTAGDIKKVAERIFRPGYLNLAVIGNIAPGDKSRITKELGKV